MKKTTNIILGLFFAVSLIPVLTMGRGEVSVGQIIAQKPVLKDENGQINKAYLNDVTNYINDNFSYRDYLITVDSFINEKLFGASRLESIYRQYGMFVLW